MKEYIDVLPTNVNQVQSVSYRNGNPLVEFKIGAQDRYLLGSTIRINGQLSVTKAGGATNPADGDPRKRKNPPPDGAPGDTDRPGTTRQRPAALGTRIP